MLRETASVRLCQVAAELHARGWCLGTSGNFSVVLDRDPLQVLITASGCHKHRLTTADLVVVGPDAQPVPGERQRPSAETVLHTRIAEATGCGAVLHTHSVWNTLLGGHHAAAGGFEIAGYEMLKGLAGITTHEAAVFVPVVPNSQDIPALADHVLETTGGLRETRGFLIAGHGLYTWGSNLDEAQRHVEIFEFLFECVGRTEL